MKSSFGKSVLISNTRIAMPVGIFTGLQLTGATIRDCLTRAETQIETIMALHDHLNPDVLLTAMDLSVEAELFGSEIVMSDHEIPTVVGRRLTSLSEIENLSIPEIGDGRTRVQLETCDRLVKKVKIPVFGSTIGPLSLAGRLFGVSETMMMSMTDPVALHRLLEKVTQFLINYIMAFRGVGTTGIIMAEPVAGLLSPSGLGQFSSHYIKQIVERTLNEEFTIILHNCGARLIHLEKILESGAEIYHFSSPMDLLKALKKVDHEVILGGNLDPTHIFFNGTEENTFEHTSLLMERTSEYQNFIISSGCDIPPNSPIKNLETFFKTVREFQQ